LEIDEELCACFKDWQKAYDHANWTILMQILNKLVFTGTKKKYIYISKLYVDQNVKEWLHQGKALSVKTGRGVDKDDVCH
jgi:transposase